MALNPNNPAEVADAIASMMDEMETLSETYRVDIERAARAHSDYKLAWATAMIATIDNSGPRKMTVDEREARVEIVTNDERVIAEVTEAQSKATKEALNGLRVRLDSARSLGANLRVQT